MRLVIIGAGSTGLAAAYALRTSDLEVVVLEKSRGVSGRAATRWRDVSMGEQTIRWRYDHGAQYLSPDPAAPSARLVRDALPSGDIVNLARPVWPFDDDGTLRPDRAHAGAGVQWTYPGGIAELGHRLRDATPGLDLRLQTRAERLVKTDSMWSVETDREAVEADAVLMTAPAPQVADLLARSTGLAEQDPLVLALRAVPYRSQFSVVLGFDEVLVRPGPAYAYVNAVDHGEAGGRHPVAWLAVESDKPGRAPEGATLLLIQMSAAWTADHFDDDPAAVVAAAIPSVEEVWGPLPAPLFTDTQRWRYALPEAEVNGAALRASEPEGLFIAGDATAGKGRVHLALEEGLAVAERIEAWFQSPEDKAGATAV
ncbi:MAG: NAD(P)-binding protein [Rhodothermaceae bacterium]|nr:NAD(P)-binding protein [Rhodothermaceae bacterium]